MLYGYNLAKQKKFEVSVEVICEKINTDGDFSEDYYVYVSKEDRDFHFNQNVRGVISDGLETT
tara:strand:- start:285 stop:473 length:189 start_codon:yes stop_codon:yes gene_type:complete